MQNELYHSRFFSQCEQIRRRHDHICKRNIQRKTSFTLPCYNNFSITVLLNDLHNSLFSKRISSVNLDVFSIGLFSRFGNEMNEIIWFCVWLALTLSSPRNCLIQYIIMYSDCMLINITIYLPHIADHIGTTLPTNTPTVSPGKSFYNPQNLFNPYQPTNQSIGSLCRSNDWFLYDCKIVLIRVNSKVNFFALEFAIRSIFFHVLML